MAKDFSSIWLEIDTQGYEEQVLDGAKCSFMNIDAVQMEAFLLPFYSGAPTFEEIMKIMVNRGFQLVAIDPEFSDAATDRLLQADLTFHRY